MGNTTTTARREGSQVPPDPSTDPVLTIDEAGRLAHVCRRTIWRWAEEGRFASSRPSGGRRFISRESFLKFLLGGA